MSISPATDKQLDFILKLSAERFENEALDAMFNLANAGTLEKGTASRMIKGLLETPKLAQPQQSRPAPVAVNASNVLAGRYAVEVEGTLRFFKVDVPESGKWAGYVFVKQLSSDDEYPVKGQRKALVLAAIEADPKAASVRYGSELGKCGVCNRTLTDEASRAAGIGPVCAQNAGW